MGTEAEAELWRHAVLWLNPGQLVRDLQMAVALYSFLDGLVDGSYSPFMASSGCQGRVDRSVCQGDTPAAISAATACGAVSIRGCECGPPLPPSIVQGFGSWSRL